MAFGKTAEQILAEEFPGKTKEQIKEILASFDAVKAKADKVDSVEANLANTTGELAALKTKLTALESKNQNNNNNNNNNNNINNNEPTYNWNEDAEDAFRKMNAEASKPIIGLALQTQAELIYDRVVNKLEREDPHFPILRKEFDEMLAKDTNLANKASQIYVENCYNVVFARHRNEIMRDVKAGSGAYFVETGRGQGGGQEQRDINRVDTTKTLSEEEKREARKFGLTDEKWLETRNKIKFVGGAIQQM